MKFLLIIFYRILLYEKNPMILKWFYYICLNNIKNTFKLMLLIKKAEKKIIAVNVLFLIRVSNIFSSEKKNQFS